MPPVMRGRAYWQVECRCGHQRGYHTNDGNGSCAGQPNDGKAVQCQDRCMEFRLAPPDARIEKMYGPAPVGNPAEFLGKRVVLDDLPGHVGMVTEVFRFGDDGNEMCRVEWEEPEVNPRTGRREKVIGMHYAGNLHLADDDEYPPTDDESYELGAQQ